MGGRCPAVDDVTSANWYPDPEVPSRLRYWDGSKWTSHYAAMPPVPHLVNVSDTTFAAPQWLEREAVSPQAEVIGPNANWWHIPPLGAPAPEESTPRRPLRAGELLIGLGAFALVAAGFTFLRSIWSDLGLAGQATVLLIIVSAQAAGSVFATPRIRGLGEALAGSSGVTLLLASAWGYDRLEGPARYFSLLMYACAAVHAFVFFAPRPNRAKAWEYTTSAFVLVGAFGLLATSQAYLWALVLAGGGLLLSRFLFTPFAERFAAAHAVLALFHVLIRFEGSWGDFLDDRYAIAGLVALVVLAASMLLRTSYPTKPDSLVRQQSLRVAVWLPALATFGFLSTYGVFEAGPSLPQRLVFACVGFAVAAHVLLFSPKEFTKYRKLLTGGVVAFALAQLGREAVLVPSARFVEELLVTIGAEYLMLGTGIMVLGVSAWRRWIPAAFAGAVLASLGWGAVLATGLEITLKSIPNPELFTVPASLPLLVAAFVAYGPQTRSSRPFLPAMLLVLVPALIVALTSDGANTRFSVLVATCLFCLFPGFRFRLYVLVVPPGVTLLLLFVYRTLGLLGDSWVTLALAAFVLLVAGSLFEKMRDRVRAARTYLVGLR